MASMSRREFRKSSYSSAEHECVEVGRSEGFVKLRDSKDPDAGTLDLPVGAARRLFDALRVR